MRAFRVLVLASALIAGGCAEDHYSVMPDSPGLQARLVSDLRACKQWALNEHFARQNQVLNGVLGLALGAVGGIITAATQPAENNPNRLTEQCMRQRGYVGTSSG